MNKNEGIKNKDAVSSINDTSLNNKQVPVNLNQNNCSQTVIYDHVTATRENPVSDVIQQQTAAGAINSATDEDHTYASSEGSSSVEEINPELQIDENGDNEHGEENQTNPATNLTLLSWNIESLLDKICLDGFCDFIKQFDIIGLGETYTNKNFDFSKKFNDYEVKHSPAESFSRLGRPSGGLVLLIKKSILNMIEFVETGISHIIGLRIKKEYLKSTKDILYFYTYIHPAGSIFYSNKEYQNTMEELEQCILDQLDGKDDAELLIGGDLNARVGDWSYQEDCELGENEEEEQNKTFYRKTEDVVINNYGKRLIEMCTMFSLTPLGGLIERNFDSKFTFIGHRGSSHIDHFVASTSLVNQISDFQIEDRIESNHLPITMKVNCAKDQQENNQQKIQITKIKWQEEKIEECKEVLAREKTKRSLKEAERKIETHIDGSIKFFSKVMTNINSPMKKSFL